MTSPLWGKYCDGGHYCSAPKECCTLGCCYHALPANGVLGLWFVSHWYFWALLMAVLLAMLCACSLWRRCWRALSFRAACSCCGSTSCTGLSSGREDRASEPDSAGSCYAPPHYSRCNSFHHAPPPPYAEVTSKPDLYPLVISYNGDTGMKRGGSASYLMVQYFRNYILRPSGSISATSTIDSLSSSFICNAANEANTVIPPPYSCTGSLEGFSFTANSNSINDSQIVHSASSITCNEFQQIQPTVQSTTINVPVSTQENVTQNSPKVFSKNVTVIGQTSTAVSKPKNGYSPVYIHNKTTSFINNIPNVQRKSKFSTENSLESDENNFSELLNLSVCAPINSLTEEYERENQHIVNSVTVSDISSLANLGTPDSPPRATSPTVEIRELLDKIQQLPQQKSPAPENTQKTNKYFVKNKNKTLYMPLNKQQSTINQHKVSGTVFLAGNSSIYGKTKNWLSRSAPTTPCGNFVPLFPSQRKTVVPKSHTGSKSKMDDASALLTELEISDEENVKL